MIDGHNDLAWAMRVLCDCDLDEVDLSTHVEELHTDLPRLLAGGVTGQFWSVYVPSTLPGGEALTATIEQIDFVVRMIDRHSSTLAFAATADDIDRLRGEGRIASLLGMEGGHSINGSLAALRMMYDLGVRYMTLTHNHNTFWADSATDEPVLGGMSEFGEQVVAEMNWLGMLVDLSHVSPDVMRQAMACTSAPVMFSHSSARALCDVARNVPDDVLYRLPANGGLCMVTFVADFVSPDVAAWVDESRQMVAEVGGDPQNPHDVAAMLRQRARSHAAPVATIDHVVAHIEHVRDVAGIDHVGLGGDFDGATLMPAGLDDVAGYPRLFDALTERGWSGSDLGKLASGNVIRVLRDAESCADRAR